MYRESANPNVRTELYALDVVVYKGSELVRLLGALAIVFAVALAVSLIKEPPSGLPPIAFDLGLLAGLAAFTAPAIIVHRRRRRRLTIEQHGDAIKLCVRATGAALDFPIECHGAQVTMRYNGVPTYTVYLQLVDRERRAVTLIAQRGAIHGPQQYWELPPIDSNVVRSDTFNVPMHSLAGIRARVEALNARAEVAPSVT